MKIVYVNVEKTHMEVPCPDRQGRPSYRLAPGYYVYRLTDGAKMYPPLSRADMFEYIREIGGPNARPRYIK